MPRNRKGRKKRCIVNFKEAIWKIMEHGIWELAPLFPELSALREKNFRKVNYNYNYTLCPFHNEKTPSFSWASNRMFYNCFGCQNGGSIIDFYMKMKHKTFFEAFIELAQFFKVKLIWANVCEITKRDRTFYDKKFYNKRCYVR